MPLKRIIPKYGRRQTNFRASTSELSMTAKHKSMKTNNIEIKIIFYQILIVTS